MAIIYEDDKIRFEKRVYENELEDLKKHLDGLKKAITVDLTACDDLHGSVVQLLLAYKTLYSCQFEFSEQPSTYKMALEGFRSVENDCNQ